MIKVSFGKKHTIVLIALDQDMIKIITAYLSHKYHFVAINFERGKPNLDLFKLIEAYSNIHLFIINVDSPFIDVKDLLDQIKKVESIRSIPKIGLSLKMHHKSMCSDIRLGFEDFLLMPCGHEDLLTRIEVWIATYRSLFEQENAFRSTYSLDTLS